MRNSLYHGDCKEILSSLKSNSVNLIYLDPPFFTNREFEICDNNDNHLHFKDLWENDINKYLDFMNDILNQSIRVLKKTGLVFLHCDYHASHYLKIEMDKTFGLKNFRNEIIWKRHNSQNNAKQGSKIFGRTHDTILIYSKTNNYFWNHQFSEYSETYLKKTYNKIDSNTGERYALGDLSGPGGSSKGNPFFEFLGFKKYWRYNEEKMNQLLAKNKIVQTTPHTVPKFKRYLKDMNGVQLNDIWTDIPNDNIEKDLLKNNTKDEINNNNFRKILKNTKINNLRRHILKNFKVDGIDLHLCFDFQRINTIEKSILNQQCTRIGRLDSPYIEKMQQDYGNYSTRLGIPSEKR